MRALFFGAGALGTLYAVKLALAGHEVSVLARGARFEAIRRDGLRIRRGRRALETTRPRLVESLASEPPYDVVIVLVRRAQVDAALERIAAEHRGDVLVMVNDARGYERWRALLGERLIVGFAGALGAFDEAGVLAYDVAPRWIQPTVIGEPDGRRSPRVSRIAQALREAGFPVAVRTDMEAWQQTHAAWITPIMLAAAVATSRGLSSAELARTWARATREALEAVRGAGTSIVPAGLRLARLAPTWLTALAMRMALAVGPLRRQLVASGVASAPEGITLVDDLAALAARGGRSVDALAELRDEAARAIARGSVRGA